MTVETLDPLDLALLLPPDAVLTPVVDLEARLRAGIDCDDDHIAVTRPGSRSGTRVVSPDLARLLEEFRCPTSLVDGLLRFSVATGQHPLQVADDAFTPLQALAAAGVLVPADSPEADAAASEYRPGRDVAGYKVVRVVRALADSQLLEATAPDGSPVAVKLSRSGSSGTGEALAGEAAVLRHLRGALVPRLLSDGRFDEQDYVAMEWRPGVPITAAAARLRAAGDAGAGLHRLCLSVLLGYVELHAAGVLHGDVHPGNLLVGGEGEVTLLDFGRAWLGETVTPAVRAGVPFFFEPELAATVLRQGMPPPPTQAGEQYAVAALLYLLLTGDHHVEPSPEQTTLLERIVNADPLPFTRRRCRAWPEVEGVLRRALAKNPEERFVSMVAFCDAFAAVAIPPPGHRLGVPSSARALGDPDRLPAPSLGEAWFAYRASLAFDDPDALAAADLLLTGLTGAGGAGAALRALVARARGDRADFAQSTQDFVDQCTTAVGSARLGSAAMLSLSALLLDAGAEREPLARLVATTLARVASGASHPVLLQACVRACVAGGLRIPVEVSAHLRAIEEGPAVHLVPLWCTAAEALGDEPFAELATQAGRQAWLDDGPDGDDVGRAFALLRLYQYSGDDVWRHRAAHLADRAGSELLLVELHQPEWAEAPWSHWSGDKGDPQA